MLYGFGNDYDALDGTGVRDYINVVDLAKGHVLALEYADKHPGCELFKLGTGKGFSVLDLVKIFELVNEITIPYEFTACREGDLPSYYADASKAEKVLGFKAEKGLTVMRLAA